MAQRYSVYVTHAATDDQCGGQAYPTSEDDLAYLDELFADFGAAVSHFTRADAAHEIPQEDVTVVLVGEETWRSAEVDRQVAASLRSDGDGPRCGVFGIVLPSYDYPSLTKRNTLGGDEVLHATAPRDSRYWAHNVPRRLQENVRNGFAKMRPWPKDAAQLAEWIEEAVEARDKPKAWDAVVNEAPPASRGAKAGLGWSDHAPVSGMVMESSKVNIIGDE